MVTALCNKGGFVASSQAFKGSRQTRVCTVTCRAQVQLDRRAALGMVAGASTLLVTSAPAFATYGDSANVFGKVTNKSGFVPYSGDGFALLLPAKWNPSKERDFSGVVLRYEDNGAAANNLMVIQEATDKKSMEEFGTPEQFLERVSYLLGQQSYSGETQSEGGFAPNRVAAGSILELATETDKKGKTYYKYEVLVRTADGDEGGKHQLIKATVSNGQLYLLKIQAGDKRWFKGMNKTCNASLDSFTVA